jgi:hypothetical protein
MILQQYQSGHFHLSLPRFLGAGACIRLHMNLRFFTRVRAKFGAIVRGKSDKQLQ